MNAIAAIAAYQGINLETEVMTADSHKLTAMLFDGALVAINRAKGEMQQGRRDAQGAAISKAISIVGDGLLASVDLERGGEIARNLSALYQYMIKRLVSANVANDERQLDEVAHLLEELQDAWNAIRPQVIATANAATGTGR